MDKVCDLDYDGISYLIASIEQAKKTLSLWEIT